MKKILPLIFILFAFSAIGAGEPIQRNQFSTNAMPKGMYTNSYFVFDAAHRIYDIRLFGASNNAAWLTNCYVTNASRTLFTDQGGFSSADLNKVISIYYAGTNGRSLTTTITNVVSANRIMVADTVSTSQGPVSAIYGWDDTAYIQSALNFLVSNSVPGGTLVFDGLSIVNGVPQNTGAWTNHNNAQLIIPPVSTGAPDTFAITFRGVSEPSGSGAGVTTNKWSFRTGNGMWSTLTYGNDAERYSMIDARNFVTPTVSAVGIYASWLNAVQVNFNQMVVGGMPNANISLLNLSGVINHIVEKCVVTQGPLINNVPFDPGTNSYAIQCAGLFNDFHSVVRESRIGEGFNFGIEVCDSTAINNVLIMGCSNAIVCNNGTANPIKIDGLIVQDCANVFRGGFAFSWANVSRLTVMDNTGIGKFRLLRNDPQNAFFIHGEYNRFVGGQNVPAPSIGINSMLEFMPFNQRFRAIQSPYLFTNARGNSFGEFGAFSFGADSGTNTVTASTVKAGFLTFPKYAGDFDDAQAVWLVAVGLPTTTELHIGGSPATANHGFTDVFIGAAATVDSQGADRWHWRTGAAMVYTNTVSTWPTAAPIGGAFAIVNSNSIPYILVSGPNSTAWTSTNRMVP